MRCQVKAARSVGDANWNTYSSSHTASTSSSRPKMRSIRPARLRSTTTPVIASSSRLAISTSRIATFSKFKPAPAYYYLTPSERYGLFRRLGEHAYLRDQQKPVTGFLPYLDRDARLGEVIIQPHTNMIGSRGDILIIEIDG